MSRTNAKTVEQSLDQALRAINGNDWHAQQAEIAKLSAPDDAKTPVIFNIISMADKIPHRRADIIKIVQFMLVESARTLNLADANKNNLYHIAAQFMPELIKSIYNANKNVSSILTGNLAMINWLNANNVNPLEAARNAGKAENVQLLLSHGAEESIYGKANLEKEELHKKAWEARLAGKIDPAIEKALKDLPAMQQEVQQSIEKVKEKVKEKAKAKSKSGTKDQASKDKGNKKDSKKRKEQEEDTVSVETTMTDLPGSPESPEKWAQGRKGSKNPRSEESPTPSAKSEAKPSGKPRTKEKSKDKAKLLGGTKSGKGAAKQ